MEKLKRSELRGLMAAWIVEQVRCIDGRDARPRVRFGGLPEHRRPDHRTNAGDKAAEVCRSPKRWRVFGGHLSSMVNDKVESERQRHHE